MNLSEITLEILEHECSIAMPELGDSSLREKLQQLQLEIKDIYPASGEALKYWQLMDLNPKWLSLSGEYNEIQLKENIILPILNLAKVGIHPFLMAKCPEYPLFYKNEQIQLEGIADLVYGKAPVKVTTYLELPFICVHEYKRVSNPVTISRAFAQLLGGLWIIRQQNQEKGHMLPVYGLMVKGQSWHFAELHATEPQENFQYRACLDFGGFSIEPDLAVILRSLRYYFLQGLKILESQTA